MCRAVVSGRLPLGITNRGDRNESPLAVVMGAELGGGRRMSDEVRKLPVGE
jgi:hypothetical protein